MTTTTTHASTAHVQETLQAWFVQHTGAEVDRHTAFLDAGLLDSFDVIDLVAYLEDSFGIQLTADDFQSPDFGTLHGLAGLVQARLAHA